LLPRRRAPLRSNECCLPRAREVAPRGAAASQPPLDDAAGTVIAAGTATAAAAGTDAAAIAAAGGTSVATAAGTGVAASAGTGVAAAGGINVADGATTNGVLPGAEGGLLIEARPEMDLVAMQRRQQAQRWELNPEPKPKPNPDADRHPHSNLNRAGAELGAQPSDHEADPPQRGAGDAGPAE